MASTSGRRRAAKSPPALQPIPPILHAVGGSLGSAFALLMFFPLERARIEMQSASPEHHAIEKQFDEEGDSSSHEDASDFDDTQEIISPAKDDSWVQFSEQEEHDKRKADDHEYDEASWSMSSPTNSEEDSSSVKKRSKLVSCLVELQQRGELYRGVSPVITTMAASNFVFFYAHAVAKRYFLPVNKTLNKETPSLSRSLLASCVAGIVNVLITNPLWVANLRIVQGESKTSSLFREVKHILRTEGKSHLWNGTWASLLLVSNPVIQFFLYEQLKSKRISQRRDRTCSKRPQAVDSPLTPVEAFLLGAFAKATATVVTYPLQLAQVLLRLQRKQQHNSDSFVSYNGTLDCFQKLVKKGGVVALFRGMEAKLLQTVLTAAFQFLTYEQILQALCTFHVAFYRRRLQSRHMYD